MDISNYIGLFLALLLLISTIFLYYKRRYKDFPPGPYGLPLIGYQPFMGENPIFTLRKLGKKYGSVMSVNLGMNNVVFLSDWKAVKEALGRQGAITIGRPNSSIQGQIFTDCDFIFTYSEKWKEQRLFTMNTLRELGMGRSSQEDMFMYEVDRLTDYLNRHTGEPISIEKLFLLPVTNAIWRILTGSRLDDKEEFLTHFKAFSNLAMAVGNYDQLQHFPLIAQLSPKSRRLFQAMKAGAKIIKDEIEKEVDLHEANFQNSNQHDFINVYLAEIYRRRQMNPGGKDVPPYDREHLVQTVFDLAFAGEDTIDSSLRWALLHMVLNPQIQRKVQEELDSVIAKDSFLPWSSKSQAPYTEATLLEALRHPTMGPLSLPHCTIRDMELFGYKIPKDTTIIVNTYAMHHDEDYWGDPDVFRPERFLTEDGRKVLKHDSLMPFSIGPRVCPGDSMAKLEMHLMFTSILRRFTLETIAGQPKPSDEFRPGLTFRMHPFQLIFKPR